MVIFLTMILAIISGEDSNAIPAFARKYQISCQVCHSPVMPRLKAFGDEFAGNGFRLTGYESPRYFIPAGDEKLSLLRELPLAIRMDGFATYNFNNEGSADFGAPFVLKLLSGGELSDKLSYYFYFLLNERGSIAGIEDAFLIYHDLFKTGINITAGQFQASDPLFKSELRYTLEPYKIYDARPSYSSASLRYERGIILDRGFRSGTSVFFEVLNGSGIGEAGEGFLFDRDKYKNVMLRLSQDVGKSISFGVFGYLGKEDILVPNPIGINKIWMAGPDLTIDLDEKLIINLQYMIRNDRRRINLSDWTDKMTHGGFAEVIYSPKGDMSKWYLTGLFNYIESDENDIDYTSGTLHAGYLLRRNVRLVSEFTWKFSGVQYGQVNAGFVAAF